MSHIGKSVRICRFLREDGRTVIVPMEMLGERPWNKVLEEIINAGADAILVTYGILKQYYRDIAGRIPFILTIPIDCPEYVKIANRAGADGVKVHYFGQLNELPETRVAHIAEECDRKGLPFLFEPVFMKEKSIDLNPEVLKLAVRQAISLGADIVKIYSEPESFKEVTEACPVPVVMAGGPLTTDWETLKMIKDAVDNGCSGAAFGRKITQHKTPGKICRAIAGIVHENWTVEEAVKKLE